MSVGGTNWAGAATLDMGANTFDISTTSAGPDQPYFSGFWVYTPSANVLLHLDTEGTTGDGGGDPDTYLEVRTGSDPGTVFAHDDDGGTTFLSSLDVLLTAGQTYHIRVGTYDGSGDNVVTITLNASISVATPGTVYYVDGVNSPPGGQFLSTMVDVAANTVTVPSVGFATDDPDGYNEPHLHWRFTATTTAKVTFNSELTYQAFYPHAPVFAGVAIAHSNVGPNPASFSSDTTGLPGTGTSRTVDVVAGETYVITLYNFAAIGSTAFVLLISDYGIITDWTQPADEQWVLANPESADNQWHPADIAPLVRDAFGTHADQQVSGPTTDLSFKGVYGMQQSFAGDIPATHNDALLCMWLWASQGSYGGQFWSLVPNGDGSPGNHPDSWNGTNPYDAGHPPGAGTCMSYTSNPESSGADSYVGVIYDAGGTGIGLPQLTNFNSYAVDERVWLRQMLDGLGPWGGQALPTPPAVGATLEWEADTSELLGMDASPDQGTDATFVEENSSGDPVIVHWYVGAGGYTALEENSVSGWGPTWEDSGGGFVVHTWLGGADMAAYLAAQDLELPTFTNSSGDDHAWYPVPSGTLTAALAYEDAWQVQWDSGIDLSSISSFTGGLKAVGIPEEILNSGVLPGIEYDSWNSTDGLHGQRYRTKQLVAYRVQVRPARYRWYEVPVLPTVTTLTRSITGTVGPDRTRFIP